MSDDKLFSPHAFGKAVTFYRELKGWRRYRLAKAAGRQTCEIRRVEEARTSPQMDTFIWIAAALGIDPVKLLQKMLEFMETRAPD